MEYNGKKGVHTTTFLNEVHAVMSAKYLTNKQIVNANTEIELLIGRAKELQESLMKEYFG